MTEFGSGDTRDRLVIRGLELRCVVGVEEWERRMAQRVVVDIELRGDFSAAAESDDLAEAVDYRLPCVEAARLAGDGEYLLIETLADRIALAVLEVHDCVERVTVSVFQAIGAGGIWEGGGAGGG